MVKLIALACKIRIKEVKPSIIVLGICYSCFILWPASTVVLKKSVIEQYF